VCVIPNPVCILAKRVSDSKVAVVGLCGSCRESDPFRQFLDLSKIARGGSLFYVRRCDAYAERVRRSGDKKEGRSCCAS
jgi:hypothetical protein